MSKMEDRLVYMVNQIGKAFARHPREQAILDIGEQIKAVWEKRMLARIFAHIDAGGAGLDELPKQALLTLRETLPK
jgi:formate dehydrogenase subunit delta